MNSFYSINELKALGLKKFGENVMISRKCSIFSPEKLIIGNNVRIDDFCILSGEITIGSYVHISAYNALYAKYGIEISDFCGISPKCTLYSATDDFSGDFMISPMVPASLTNVKGGKITLKNFVQIGSNSIIMPSVICNEGAVCGAFSFINCNLAEWTMYKGIPAKKYKLRNRKAKELAENIYGT